MMCLDNCSNKRVRRGFACIMLLVFSLSCLSGVLAENPTQRAGDKSQLYLGWLESINQGKDIAGLSEEDFLAFLNWYVTSSQTKSAANMGQLGPAGVWSPADCGMCGDATGDGSIVLGDAIVVANYLYNKLPGPACLAETDIDDYQSTTIRDLHWLLNDIFNKPCGPWTPICPAANPPIQPVLHALDTLKIKSGTFVPAGMSSAIVTLTYSNTDSIYDIVLPLEVRIGGEIPTIDSVIGGPRTPADGAVDTVSGRIRFIQFDIRIGPGSDTLMTIYLTFPPDPANRRLVTIDTTTYPPTHYPMFLDSCYLDAELPTLCSAKPGDGDGDNSFTLADVMAIANYIFKNPGWPSCPDNNYTCWPAGQLTCRGDWNGNQEVALDDVMRVVNYIFKRPGWPVCPADDYTCWLPPVSGVCCLPVP